VMFRYLPFVILVGFALEIASIVWVGNALGLMLTLILILTGALVGTAVFRSAGMGMSAALRRSSQDPFAQLGMAGATLLTVVSGILFFIPGFFSDALAIILLIPPVQMWLISRLKIVPNPGEAGSQGDTDRRFETVIEAEATEISGEIIAPDPPAKKR
jgi:UPF0716 protein FxsA